MREITGKYNSAKIFTDLVEDKAIEQIQTLLDQEFIKDSKIRIMPDVHAGAGCTIGTTMTIKDKVCPNLVGVDIGCGMYVAVLEEKNIDLKKLDKFINEHIPSGFNIRETQHEYNIYTDLGELRCKRHVDLDRAKHSLGTLGGGNHFVEVDRDDDGHLYLVIHSGSRHLGVEVASYYQKLARTQQDECEKATTKYIIDMLKISGNHSVIEKELKKIKRYYDNIPKDLCHVFGQLLKDYIHDMEIVQRYATNNRLAIADDILNYMGLDFSEEFETVHNYIDTENMILRKGAVSAKKDERILIPINMRDGSLICVGKGNPDWNYSAPHGAGRLMSRSEARKNFSVDEFSKTMDGIYTTSVCAETIDECPMAYKPIESIINNIGDTVTIEKVIKPIYNFKAKDVKA